MKEAAPDIVALQEIKMQEVNVEKYLDVISKDYAQYWNCSTKVKGYSGTALFTKLKPLEVSYGLGIDKHDGEGRVLTAEFKEFILVLTYVPNSG